MSETKSNGEITTHASLCRFCHAGCPISVDMQDGKPVKVTGNKESPTYFGFCCSRGQALPEQIHHPERLYHSQKRMPDGSYQDIPIEVAMDEIAEKVQSVIGKHGPRSLAMYIGTYSAPYPGAGLSAGAWGALNGTPMIFSSATIDQPGKEIAAALFGHWLAGPQLLDGSDVSLLIGNNPLISISGGGVPCQNPARRLTDALDNGLKLIVIDPRETETAKRAHIHLQPRPGEDAVILAAMIHVILAEDLIDHDFVSENIQGLEALRAEVDAYTPEVASARADVPAEKIIAAARMFASAKRGIAAGATGFNMSGRSSLNEYLLNCLNGLCGRFIKEGEPVPNPGVLLPRATPKAQAEPPKPAVNPDVKLRVRDLCAMGSGMPTAALADEILLEGDDRVRMLFSCGGNPVAAIPDQDRIVEALDKLDLFVQIDIKMSSSAKQADYVIAPKISLEVPTMSYLVESIETYNALWGLCEPFGMYAPKLMDPPEGSDLIEEWEFFYGLAQRMGLDLFVFQLPSGTATAREDGGFISLDMENKPTSDEFLELLTTGSRVPLSEVKKHPNGKLYPEDICAAPKDTDCTARLEVGNEDMMAELRAMKDAVIVAHREGEAYPYLMISRRMAHVYNSAGRDLPSLIRKGGSYNPAYMHPQDLAELGLSDGDSVEVASPHGAIPSFVAPDETLRRGLVSMAHAFGDSPKGNPNVRAQGSNTGALASVEDDYDKFSGIPRMSALPVSVRPIPS